MKSKLIKLDAPYNVIYAGGKVGRHIATLMVWNDDEEAVGGIMDAASYPVIDEGEEFPAGTLCDNAELHDCRVICSYSEKRGCPATNLYWLAHIMEYDFQQIEPAGTEYILERLKLLNCKITLPVKKDKETGEEVTIYDYEASLYISKVSGPIGFDEEGEFYVTSNVHSGFYFQSEGTPEEIYHDLHHQKRLYLDAFHNEPIDIRFTSNDGYLYKMIDRLNEASYM